MAPQKHSPAIKKGAKVAVIGAGRIGCELLKTLALSGCQDIHIIDKDVVQVDDLNGQFLFQQSHVGESKAIVAGRAVLEFRPHISITPYHEDVKGPFFDEDFLQQFHVVLSAIGNLNTKRVVNRVCIDADVPFIQSWTDGFLGQVTVHVKGKTECYECQPKPAPKTHPVCTITSTTPYDIFKHGLFDGEAIIGIPTIATTNAIIAGLMVIETLKVLQEDTKNYRMTCCLEHPTNKMLLMPVEPCEPNKSCYVCSEMPLSLEIEINTKCASLQDIVEKVVKRKLGMNSPLIRHGAALLYVSDTDDDDEISAYEENLNTVFSELSSPVTSGSMLSIMDFQQRLTCYISIKHREEFDEEKEPDGMVLSGLTPATSVVKDDDKKSNANAGSTSSVLELEADKNDEIESAPGKKRKRSEVSEAYMSSVAGDTKCHRILKVDDEISIGKRSRSGDWEKEPHHLGTNPGASAAAPSLINKGFKFGEPKAAGVASSYSPLVIGGQGCRICGDGCHHTVTCPLLKYARPGSTVGPDYLVICGECGDKLRQPTPKQCLNCGERGGLAVEVSTYDKLYGTDCLPRFWEPVESEDDYMELDNYMDLVESIDLENHIAEVARAYMESSWCKRFSSTVVDS